MKTITLGLDNRGYSIHIGQGIYTDVELYSAHIKGERVFIITNETVATYYLKGLQESLADYLSNEILIADGEKFKNLTTLNSIFNAMLQIPCDRLTTVVALGGGVVGDIAGFAAACYQRGISFMQIPTTLLAQVDSSVGGKTGINHRLGKNMIGAFHQPSLVICDLNTLNTLPQREFVAGLAEVIKYGLIRNKEFYDWCLEHVQQLLAREPEVLSHAVHNSCQIKADVVAKDEKEIGLRAILNLGHSFAHAIETATQYREWLHGEAVACGLLMATELSHRQGWLEAGICNDLHEFNRQCGLPVMAPSSISADEILHYMQFDKKNLDGRKRLVLLQGVGNAIITTDYDPTLLSQTIRQFTQ